MAVERTLVGLLVGLLDAIEHDEAVRSGSGTAAALMLAGLDKALPPPEVHLIDDAQPLLKAIDKHLAWVRTWQAALGDGLDGGAAPARTIDLTDRELEVLVLVFHGLTASAASRRMGCSLSTVNKHLGNAYRKLGVNDRLSAVLAAQRRGLLPGVPRPRPQDASGA